MEKTPGPRYAAQGKSKSPDPSLRTFPKIFRVYRLKSRVGCFRCPRSDLRTASAPVAKASKSSLPLLWGHEKGGKCPPPSYQKAPLAAQFGDPHMSPPPVNVPCVALKPHRHEPEESLPEIGEHPPYMRDVGAPQDFVVPGSHEHTRKEIFWKALVTHVVTYGGTLRLWTRS